MDHRSHLDADAPRELRIVPAKAVITDDILGLGNAGCAQTDEDKEEDGSADRERKPQSL
jgi:hypothetical protein